MRAYAALADNCAQYSILPGMKRDALCAKGRESARRAIELDPTVAEVHVALANIAFQFDWDWALAGREFRCRLPQFIWYQNSGSSSLFWMQQAQTFDWVCDQLSMLDRKREDAE
jgi:hypothetical protein